MLRPFLAASLLAASAAVLTGCATHTTPIQPAAQSIPTHRVPPVLALMFPGAPRQDVAAPGTIGQLLAPAPEQPTALSLFFPTSPTYPAPTGDATPDQFMRILTSH